MNLDRLLQVFEEPQELVADRNRLEAAKSRATARAALLAQTDPLHPLGKGRAIIDHKALEVVDDGATILVIPMKGNSSH